MVGNEIEIVSCEVKIEPFMLIQCLDFIGVIHLCLPKKSVTNVEYKVDG